VARQPGQQRQGQAGESGQSGDQPDEEGNSAVRIEQARPGEDVEGAGIGQPGQLGDQSGEGAEEGMQGVLQSARPETDTSEDPGASGGAGDSEGGQQEGAFAASGETIDQNNAPDGSGLTEFEPVFAPRAIGGEGGQQVQLGGSGEPGDTVIEEGNFVEGPEGESIIGYDRVYSDYANAARQALQRDYIPLSLRDVIRNYFASLEP